MRGKFGAPAARARLHARFVRARPPVRGRYSPDGDHDGGADERRRIGQIAEDEPAPTPASTRSVCRNTAESTNRRRARSAPGSGSQCPTAPERRRALRARSRPGIDGGLSQIRGAIGAVTATPTRAGIEQRRTRRIVAGEHARRHAVEGVRHRRPEREQGRGLEALEAGGGPRRARPRIPRPTAASRRGPMRSPEQGPRDQGERGTASRT